MKKIYLVLILIMLAAPFVFAQSGLQKIEEYNKKQALFYLENLSFFVAFAGGMISVLLPCTLAILPAFFAYTFKERKEITKMTFVFFAGFSLIFVVLGLLASALGQSLTSLQEESTKIWINAAGFFIILFGIMTLLGKGFQFISIERRTGHDIIGIFIFGILFGLGWSACLGPILAGILLIAATFSNYFYSGMLLFAYSLGLFVPLFLLSVFFDKFSLAQKPWLRGKEYKIKIFGRDFFIHTTKAAAGVMLIATGILFIAYNGTKVINDKDPLRTSYYAYLFEDRLLGIPYIGIISMAAFALFAVLIAYSIHRINKQEGK